MACPAPTAEPGPNWLDRLRSSKGFPPHHAGLDLDHFLLSPSESNPNPSPPPQDSSCAGGNAVPAAQQRREKPAAAASGERNKWFDLMSCALAELFHMGDSRELLAARAWKKTSRKQPNPRICVASAPDVGSCHVAEQGAACGGAPPAASPPSAENSAVCAKKFTKARRKRASRGVTSGSSDLSAYSRTEVTVIDTSSSPSWKSQKIIFRKGLVWKVRDKQSWIVCRKKRRLGVVKRLAGEKEQEEVPVEKRKEVLVKEHLASSNDVLCGSTQATYARNL